MELRQVFEAELNSILSFWMKHAIDTEHGGFVGKMDHNHGLDNHAPKGSVLNARILWSFSAAYLYSKNKEHLDIAKRAYTFITDHFYDHDFGGVYWTVDYNGQPLDTKKQVYALAFTLYGLTEYYRASKDPKALKLAFKLYDDIEKYSFDKIHGGYLEAFTRNWQSADDLRLSAKDANEKKTMNTHLHILEAYTNLYRVWPDHQLKIKISALLDVFETHLINPKTKHLILFLNETWQPKSETISYGHDIEASWLLLEAAEIIQDELLIQRFKSMAVLMAEASAEGLEPDGSMIYEFEPATNHRVKEKHWWVEAETMVGFLNAWQITARQTWYTRFISCWEFTNNQIIDHEKGEWIWGIDAGGNVMQSDDKIGLWKCPYHNSRACLEIMKRLNTL